MTSIVALVPAYNEEESIAATIEALLAQERLPDEIVVIPNGCTDGTSVIARNYPVTVFELPKLEHKKPEALNRAWQQYAREADIVICLDADTVLPPNAVGDWEREFVEQSSTPVRKKFQGVPLGGSSSKFTMLGRGFLTRLQRAEFAAWTDTALARGYTTVLAGTGCAISGEALRQVVETTQRDGPWSYRSLVEDFELTYQIRQLGYRCQVSRTVRAYTDSMKTIPSLWAQRMKWQVGTVDDLLRLGINRLTLVDWGQQFMGLAMAFMRVSWVLLMAALLALDSLVLHWFWLAAVPLAFAGLQLYSGLRIPHRDRTDVLLSFIIVPSEIFAWLRAGWFLAAWAEVLVSRLTGHSKDRWHLQYAAEISTDSKRR
ncbi:hypothetical protein CR983_03640 [Candidatus Saccharibacteria bacterium]|nr:MAG: hypothetical protein CR983_03640 [Candidatus Saccharibacteria bacterium]